jgi:hypothetical protein
MMLRTRFVTRTGASLGVTCFFKDADEAPAGFDLWALPYGDPLWVEVKALSRDGEAFLDLVREVGEES